MSCDNIHIEIKELKENDIIVIKMPFDKNNETTLLPLDIAEEYFYYVKEKFPNNKVIFIIEGLELEFTDWERSYNYIMSIKPSTEQIYDCYEEDFENLKDIITKHPISVRNILEIITTSIPLIDYCGVDCLLTIINNEIKRRGLK